MLAPVFPHIAFKLKEFFVARSVRLREATYVCVVLGWHDSRSLLYLIPSVMTLMSVSSYKRIQFSSHLMNQLHRLQRDEKTSGTRIG